MSKENIQTEAKRERSMEDNKRSNRLVKWDPRIEKNIPEAIFEKIIKEDLKKFTNDNTPQITEKLLTQIRIYIRKTTPAYMIVRLLKTKDKENMSQIFKGETKRLTSDFAIETWKSSDNGITSTKC